MLYLHAAAGFPTKETCIKAIHNGNYLWWSLINVKNVNKHLPESEEIQKGHMLNQRQGVRSTKSLQAGKSSDYKRDDPEIDGDTNEVIENKQDIFIAVHDPKDTMNTDQKGKFLVR